MSKKQRRKQPQKPPAPVHFAAAKPAPVETPRIVPQRTPVVSKPKAVVSWQDVAVRYEHVNAELKQIGILAGSFLVVLLVLWAILG
jgi:hypothetical protein